jgi:hypothetical protein
MKKALLYAIPFFLISSASNLYAQKSSLVGQDKKDSKSATNPAIQEKINTQGVLPANLPGVPAPQPPAPAPAPANIPNLITIDNKVKDSQPPKKNEIESYTSGQKNWQINTTYSNFVNTLGIGARVYKKLWANLGCGTRNLAPIETQTIRNGTKYDGIANTYEKTSDNRTSISTEVYLPLTEKSNFTFHTGPVIQYITTTTDKTITERVQDKSGNKLSENIDIYSNTTNSWGVGATVGLDLRIYKGFSATSSLEVTDKGSKVGAGLEIRF